MGERGGEEQGGEEKRHMPANYHSPSKEVSKRKVKGAEWLFVFNGLS